ncbi:hypothetical protein SAMN04487843_12923 [Methylobacterium sp. ap11]|uniref:hypothetical protein n=1 Tax=Methylobacterium sp. ap11 TaxID=1761799 RepID=UPI0008C4C9EB|nr:hypothetical protein [Methylobacterium sp. ap11]SEP49092.1 hypothetical protein SAMN04487843_12923 [Methylobacterium sp. ap11]
MIHQATSSLVRDYHLRAAAKISGDGRRPVLDTLNAHPIQAYGAGQLLDEHVEEVFQAVYARRTRMAAAAALHQVKTGAGSAKGCVTPLGAFASDRLAALGNARPGSLPAQPPLAEIVAPRGKASPTPCSGPRRRLTLAERATSQPAARRR